MTEDEAGSNGWFIPKFHSLFGFPQSMIRFGCGRVFDSGPGEEHHKEFIKAPANNTSRNKYSFTDQLSQRSNERGIVKRCAYEVSEEMISPLTRSRTKTNEVRVSGMYTLFITKSEDNDDNQYCCQTYWHDHKKRVNKDDFVLHHLLTYAIVDHAKSHCFNDDITVTGFTEAHFNSTTEHTGEFVVRASPNYMGSKWHDWAIVSVPKCEESRKLFKRPPGVAYHCFARVLGFISYEKSPGYPTYYHHDAEKRSIQGIYEDRLIDVGMYVVVECNEDRVDIDQLGQQLVFPFKMSHELNKLRIFPVSAIVSPLAVVTDWRSKTSVHYLACMPRRKWRQVFNNRVQEKMSYLQNSELEDMIHAPDSELYSSEEESEEENNNEQETQDRAGGETSDDLEVEEDDEDEIISELPVIEETSDEESLSGDD